MINASPVLPSPTPPPSPTTSTLPPSLPKPPQAATLAAAAPMNSLQENPSISAPTSNNVPSSGKGASLPPLPQKMTPKLIIGIVILLLIVTGVGVGLYLVKQNEETRQQAAGCPAGSINNGRGACENAAGDVVGRAPTPTSTTRTTEGPSGNNAPTACPTGTFRNSSGGCETAGGQQVSTTPESPSRTSAPPVESPSRTSGGGTSTPVSTTAPSTSSNNTPSAPSGGGGGSPSAAAPSTTTTTTNNTTNTSKAVCGSTCTSDADCISQGTNGAAVGCRGPAGAQTCQNLSCIGNTQPGTICFCNKTNTCGQGCSSIVGLCAAGSTCTYIGGTFTAAACGSSQNQATPTDTVCVPNTVPSGYTLNACGGDKYLLGPGGALVSQTTVQQLCNPSATQTAANNTQLASASAPTPTPATFGCNSACTSDAQCQAVNASYVCYQSACRLATNTGDPTCPQPVGFGCNSSCSSDAQCQAVNSNFVCYNAHCRVANNVGDVSCPLPLATTPTPTSDTSTRTVNAKTTTKAAMPTTGSADMTILLSVSGLLSLAGGIFFLRRKAV